VNTKNYAVKYVNNKWNQHLWQAGLGVDTDAIIAEKESAEKVAAKVAAGGTGTEKTADEVAEELASLYSAENAKTLFESGGNNFATGYMNEKSHLVSTIVNQRIRGFANEGDRAAGIYTYYTSPLPIQYKTLSNVATLAWNCPKLASLYNVDIKSSVNIVGFNENTLLVQLQTTSPL
jgi:hypothetical protein